MITIRHEKAADAVAREDLLDRAYGPDRFGKPSARLREGRVPARGLSFVAIEERRVIGTVRLWDVAAGTAGPALLLGPLAVDPSAQRRSVGTVLMRRALQEARRRGHRAVLLVGDPAYYGRFGFAALNTGRLWMPGLADRGRLLGCELVAGALAGARGAICPLNAPRQPSAAPAPASLPQPQAA